MANMSYCRFQNTLTELKDCYAHLADDGLSKEEKRARDYLVGLCKTIVEDAEGEDEEVPEPLFAE